MLCFLRCCPVPSLFCQGPRPVLDEGEGFLLVFATVRKETVPGAMKGKNQELAKEEWVEEGECMSHQEDKGK